MFLMSKVPLYDHVKRSPGKISPLRFRTKSVDTTRSVAIQFSELPCLRERHVRVLQGVLALQKMPTSGDQHRTIGLLTGPRGGHFLSSKVPLYTVRMVPGRPYCSIVCNSPIRGRIL